MDPFIPDPDNIPEFFLPDSLLEKIYEFSGNGDHSKGFMLIFVGQQGTPAVYTKTENQIIEMGLRKAAEQYLSQSQEADIDNSFGQQEE